jgi:phosphoribulokinase
MPTFDIAAATGRQRPIFIAIGGDSGSGKSTLTAGFYRIFPEDRITSLCLDDYHSLDRRERQLLGITALNPRANNFALMENQLLALKRGDSILKPVYDHRDGTFGPHEEIRASEVVIVQGLHPFLVPGIRGLWDLKVWLDPQEELKRQWKLQRDVAKRGYTEEQVYKEIAARQPDVAAYIAPQRHFADLVVRFYRPADNRDDAHLSVRIIQRATLPRLNLDGLLDDPGNGLRAVQGEDDQERANLLEIDGNVDRATVLQLENRIWDHIDARHQHLRHLAPDQFGDFTDGVMRKHHSDPLALTQLLLVHRMLSAKKSMLLKVPLGVHESIVHEHGEEEVVHDHEHV